MNHYLLSASILSADFANLSDQLHQAESAGVDWIHIDVMDGHFVPNITMGPFIVETCRRLSSLPLDVHLMIKHPEDHIKAFAMAGANRISIHIEGNPNVHRTLQSIRSLGASPGIVLNPGSPAILVEEVLNLVDMVLVMTVNPGFSGQAHLPEMAQKITSLRKMLDQYNPSAIIQVDGGISAENISTMAKAGAGCFVAATAIFKYPEGINAGVHALRNALETKLRHMPQK